MPMKAKKSRLAITRASESAGMMFIVHRTEQKVLNRCRIVIFFWSLWVHYNYGVEHSHWRTRWFGYCFSFVSCLGRAAGVQRVGESPCLEYLRSSGMFRGRTIQHWFLQENRRENDVDVFFGSGFRVTPFFEEINAFVW